MKTEIETLLTAIETINAITPETPRIGGFPIHYLIKNLIIDENNDDEHSMYVIKLENHGYYHLNAETVNDDDYIYYDYDSKLADKHKAINPNDVLPDYGLWNLVTPNTITPSHSGPIMYTTESQDTFTINVTDYHIIITVILSGMY